MIRASYLILVATCGITAQGRVQPLYGQEDSTFARGLDAFFANRLAEALPLLRAAATSDPDQPERLLWYAETARRLDWSEEADSAVRSALRRLPCSSFAHTVLAGLYNPQYTAWPRASGDTTWLHLRAAVRCDADDGNAWLPLWVEALHHQDEALAVEALAQLTRTRFLAEPVMVSARWMLASLPRGAIVLMAGDLDTYPAVAVQDCEHVRPDVVVVNESLLNLAWYTARLHSRYGLPLPMEVDQLAAYDDTAGASSPSLSELVVGYWRRMAARGVLERPLALAFSTGPQEPSAELGALTIAGPFYLVVPTDTAPSLDASAVAAVLMEVRPADWVGPYLSPLDRSPVRRAGSVHPGVYPLYLAAFLGQDFLERGNMAEAQKWLDWAQGFSADLNLSTEQEVEIFGSLVEALDAPRPETAD